jgi:hypothetical protein
MNIDLQDKVCDFVRHIISARTGETIEISGRPERDERNREVVEQIWESPTRRYAIEHTRVEAFEGQIANQERVKRLLFPVKRVIADRLPGYFTLAVRADDLAAARFNETAAQVEIARLVLEAATAVSIGETVSLSSNALPFTVDLHLRHKDSSSLTLITDIHGDPDELRLSRTRRALDAKCPKLKEWSADGRTSVLALESDDFQHSNVFVIYKAVERALRERNDLPDVVILVESDAAPMNAWVLKDGNRFGDDVAGESTGALYVEGSVRTRIF